MNRNARLWICAAILGLGLVGCRPGRPPPEQPPPVTPMPEGPVANPQAATPQPQATPTSGGEASHQQ